MVDDQDVEDQDYTAFFRDLHMLSKVEDDVRESVKGYFRSNNNLDLQMATVTSEDRLFSLGSLTSLIRDLHFSDSKTQTQISKRI